MNFFGNTRPSYLDALIFLMIVNVSLIGSFNLGMVGSRLIEVSLIDLLYPVILIFAIKGFKKLSSDDNFLLYYYYIIFGSSIFVLFSHLYLMDIMFWVKYSTFALVYFSIKGNPFRFNFSHTRYFEIFIWLILCSSLLSSYELLVEGKRAIAIGRGGVQHGMYGIATIPESGVYGASMLYGFAFFVSVYLTSLFTGRKKITYLVLSVIMMLSLILTMGRSALYFTLIIFAIQNINISLRMVVLLLSILVITSLFSQNYSDLLSKVENVERLLDYSSGVGKRITYIYLPIYNHFSLDGNFFSYLFGSGPASLDRIGFREAHNVPLRVLFTSGLVGLVVFLTWIFIFLVNVFKSPKSREKKLILSVSLLYMLTWIPQDGFFAVNSSITFFIIVALAKVSIQRRHA